MGEIDKSTTCNATGVAAVLGISVRQVNYLVQNGDIPVVTKGKYNLAEAVQAYIRKLKEGESDDKDLDTKKKKADVAFREAKAKREKIIVRELEGQMHRAEDVEAMTEDLIYNVRSSLLALPGRLSVDVANSDSPMECSDIIKKEVYSLMTDLADYKYDPDKYEERVRNRMKWEAKEEEEKNDEAD